MSDPDPTSAEGLAQIQAITLAAAREAAALVLRGFRRRPSPGAEPSYEHKGAVDLVTTYDRDSEALLRDRLSAAFPSFAIVGEESDDAVIARDDVPTFYVDPIDGTTNFVHGHPFWCISIGLVPARSARQREMGAPVLGVVVAPALGLELTGFRAPGIATTTRRSLLDATGASTTARGVSPPPCVVSTTDRFDEALLATGFPYDRRTSPDNNFDAFVAIKKKCQGIRRCGSAALDLCLVADGTYDGYWEKKVRPWDIAAGAAIVLAAGGRVTDYDGQPCDITRGFVVATNGRIHDALLAELDAVHSARAPV